MTSLTLLWVALPATLMGVLADAASSVGGDFTPLINIGGIGTILAFVLMRIEPRLRSMEATIALNAKANMLVVIAMSQVSDFVRAQAQALVEQLDADEARRNQQK